MYDLKKMERYLRVNLLGLGPYLMKKNLLGHGLTKVEKHCSTVLLFCLYSLIFFRSTLKMEAICPSHQYKLFPL
jgi:hypothetical protein